MKKTFIVNILSTGALCLVIFGILQKSMVQKIKGQNNQLNKEIEKLKVENQTLKHDIEILKNNKDSISKSNQMPTKK